MAGELDGPRLEPQSGQAKRLVVFLHGYGADGNDLIDIGRAWQGLLPDTAFVSPHAPEPCGQAPVGKQWFPLFTRAPNERWDGVNKAGPGLEQFLDAELARRKLPPSALALVGFSQGTMMALHVRLAPRRAARRHRRLFRHLRAAGQGQARRGRWARSNRGRRFCSSTAPRTISFRRRPCSRARRRWPRSTCRSNGTCRRASATASTRRGCATAASSWPANSGCGPSRSRCPRTPLPLIRAQPAHFARFTIPSRSLYTVPMPPLRRAVFLGVSEGTSP